MPRINIDLDFLNHPKTVSISPLAQLMFIRSILYSSIHLTDGFVPLGATTHLSCDMLQYDLVMGGVPGLCETNRKLQKDDLIDELLIIGWWTETKGGYHIHDFLEHQLSKSEVEKLKTRSRTNGAKSNGRPRREPTVNPDHNPDVTQTIPRNKPRGNPEVTSLTNPNPNPKEEKEEGREEAPPHLSCEVIRTRWNALPNIKPCKALHGDLATRVRKLLTEHPQDWWNVLFTEVERSKFLTGQVPGQNGKKPFRATLDWVTGPKNLSKVLAGNYDDSDPQGRKAVF